KLEALHLHASKLADAESIEEISDYTIEAMETTLGFTWISIAVVEDNLMMNVISLRDGLLTREDSDSRSADDPGIGPRAIRTGETQLVNDVRKDVDYVGTHMDDSRLSKLPESIQKGILHSREFSDGKWASLSEIEVPVKIGQTVVALLGAESLELNAFTEQDKNLLETLANHVASAMMRLQHNKEREQVQQELALERVRVEQADELSRLKNQFISTATHELRTPVTSILGFLELVLDYSSQDLPDTVRKDLNIVFRNAMRLVDMTNDLLDVQRITSGRFEVNLEQVDLVNTLNEVVEELTPMFVEKNQVLLVDAPSELSVNVDEVRISQLFINLLRNANKFTPAEGNIGVKVEPFESHVQISVKDSGIGLSEEDIEKLFKPFPGIRHGVNVSSTGLGLAICKGIVDVHMGVIWVESDGPGEGCTFIVRLPVNQ
ncbi:MAG: ATP-binding protein, partial [Candidatus Bathyarchaeota archaeon]